MVKAEERNAVNLQTKQVAERGFFVLLFLPRLEHVAEQAQTFLDAILGGVQMAGETKRQAFDGGVVRPNPALGSQIGIVRPANRAELFRRDARLFEAELNGVIGKISHRILDAHEAFFARHGDDVAVLEQNGRGMMSLAHGRGLIVFAADAQNVNAAPGGAGASLFVGQLHGLPQ